MFNSTHTLAGLALARTGLDRWAPYATWTAIIAANLPDIDIVTSFESATSYLHHHRGITHSLVGIPVLSLMLAALMYFIASKRRKPPVPYWRHFVVAVIAMSTHPLLDATNVYGVRPFLPFSETWYYGDTLFIIDPYLDLILLSGILASYRLASRRLLCVTSAIVAAVVYLGARLELRDTAEVQLAGFVRETAASRAAVAPRMLNPFVWTGIIEAPQTISRVEIDTLRGTIDEMTRFSKDTPNPVVSRAESTRAGEVFRGFARFSVSRVDEVNDGYRVLLIDVRFFRENTNTALAAEILMDRSLSIQKESLSFNRPIEFTE